MTGAELRKLQEVRVSLRGTGLFCFEKNYKFMLYREVRDGRNQLVLTSTTIDEFVRRVNKAISK